jgi:hypothetical protein
MTWAVGVGKDVGGPHTRWARGSSSASGPAALPSLRLGQARRREELGRDAGEALGLVGQREDGPKGQGRLGA